MNVKEYLNRMLIILKERDFTSKLKQRLIQFQKWIHEIDWGEVKVHIQSILQDPIKFSYYKSQFIGAFFCLVTYWFINLIIIFAKTRSFLSVFFPHFKTLGWLIFLLGVYYLWFKSVQFYYETIRKEKLQANGEKGEAEFANDSLEALKTKQEELFEKEGLRAVKIKSDRTPYRGIPLHVDKKREYFYVDTELNHSLNAGITGGGKSQNSVLPTIDILSRFPVETVDELKGREVSDIEILKQSMYAQESMIINDVKGELFSNAYQMLKNRNYTIKVLNLKHPYHSDTWNTFEIIKEYYLESLREVDGDKTKCDLDMVTNLIDAFVEMLIAIKDQYWDSNSQSLVSAMMLAMLEDLVHLSEDKASLDLQKMYNPYTLVHLLNEFNRAKVSDEQTLLSYYFDSRSVGNLAKLKASSIITAPEKTQSTIISNTATHLKLFMNESIGRLMSSNSIRVQEMIEQPMAIFIICPDNNKSRWPLAAVFMHQAYFILTTILEKHYNDKSPRRINFIFDELAQMPAIPDLDNIASMARSRNIRLLFYLQNLKQLDNKYKENASVIQDNCVNWCCFKTSDPNTIELFLKKIGNTTVVQKSISSKMGELEGNVSESITEQAIIHGNEIVKLKKEHGIVARTGFNPIKAYFCPAWRYWTYEDENGVIRSGVRETDVIGIKERGNHAEQDLSQLLTYVQTQRNKDNLYFFEVCRISPTTIFQGIDSSVQVNQNSYSNQDVFQDQIVEQEFPLIPQFNHQNDDLGDTLPPMARVGIQNDSEFLQAFNEHCPNAYFLVDTFDKISRDKKIELYDLANANQWDEVRRYLGLFKRL